MQSTVTLPSSHCKTLPSVLTAVGQQLNKPSSRLRLYYPGPSGCLTHI